MISQKHDFTDIIYITKPLKAQQHTSSAKDPAIVQRSSVSIMRRDL